MFGPSPISPYGHHSFDQTKIDKLDPMQNQLCRVCDEPAAGFHFGAFTCEGCKSFFGRTCNNQSVIQECKNNYNCTINKKNRTACKACRLRKCLMVGMSKSGSRYGRRSNWFKIHCLMQQVNGGGGGSGAGVDVHNSVGRHRPPSLPTLGMPKLPSPPKVTSSSPPSLWRPLDVSSSRSEKSSSPKISSPSRSRLQSSSPLFSDKTNDIHTNPMPYFFKKSTSPPLTMEKKNHRKEISKSPPAPDISGPEPTNVLPSSAFAPFYHPMASSLPFLPPTFNLPALAALPLHKQAFLSPLLASSHMFAAAAAARKNHPLFNDGHQVTEPRRDGNRSPELEPNTAKILAEHKALLERFRAHLQSAAGLSEESQHDKSVEPPALTPTGTASTKSPSPSVITTSESSSHNNKVKPVNLTKRLSANEDESSCSSIDSMGSQIIPRLSDTEEEEEPEGQNADCALQQNGKDDKKKAEEIPLDLTCI